MKKNTSNSDKISENHISGINRVIKLDIVIDGKPVSHFKHFRLQQSAKTHHQFELTLAHDSLGKIQNHNLERAKQFFGKRLTVTFKYKDPENESPERTFVGVIMKVAFSQEKMSLGNIVLKGNSPTILMDSAPHTQSFGGNQPVNTSIIADRVIKESLGTNEFDFIIDTQNKGYINYSSQYCETHYNYLARIAEAYGEQFYYDGETLHFGKLPPHEKSIKLIDGSNVSDVHIELNAIHIKPEYFGYNSSNHTKMIGVDNQIKHLGELSSETYELNNNIFKTRSLTPAPVNPNMFLDIDDSQKSARGSKAVDVFTVSGKTTVPFLYTGCVADLAMRKPDSNQTSHFTTLMMTEVNHEVDARGYYTGSFQAIAEGTGFMPKPDFIMPKAESQVATVISNVDPLNQGRIQVRFDWQLNDTTHFIRMMSPDAGGTDAISQNRGFVAVPEIGDQVMVGFEYHNPDFPFAMGGMFHGNVALGGGVNNHLKSIQTRSGIKVLMNDANGSVTIQDPSGNIYYMDGGGNINVTAPNKITMNATDVEINANNNFDINVTNNMTSTVGNTAMMNYLQKTLMNTPVMLQTVTNYLHTQAGKVLINSENEIKIEAKETSLAGFKKLFVHSDESTIVNSKGTVQVKGTEGTSNTNVADSLAVTEITLDATCIVHFRPKSNWKGEFGFDWFRIGDTSLDGDNNYGTLIGQYYDKLPTDATAKRNTNVNSWTTFFQTDPQPASFTSFNRLEGLKNLYGNYYYSFENDLAGNPIRKRYYRSIMTIFPRRADPTNPRKNVETGEASLELYLEFQKADKVEVKPDKVVFEVDNLLANEEHSLITISNHTILKKDLKKKITIDLKFKTSFDKDKDINVWAVMLDETDKEKKKEKSRQFAGVLKIIAPSKQRTQDIVIVRVKTPARVGSKNSLDNIKKNLKQALINVNVVEKSTDNQGRLKDIIVDVTDSTNNHLNIDFNSEFSVQGINIKVDQGTKGVSLDDFLKIELEKQYPNQFTNHFKLFFLANTYQTVVNDDGTGSGVAGYSNIKTDYGIMFSNHSAVTIGHECMHGLGLHHTFYGDDYIYKAQKTDNVMDYSHLSKDKVTNQASTVLNRISTWYWQWNKINSNINL
ncbi:MAG: type VI secretion system Vgr family protein [Chryseobacterium jejuense]|uniref:type VI secretion system Vgr family protein n=1 Tax=Chryseobacterium jejuense TaxID=445960 RepID=UPI003D09E84D